MSQSRYRIGIDLGTSHSAVAYLDTMEDGISTGFPVEQWQTLGTRGASPTLPSLVYVATKKEVKDQSFQDETISEESAERFAVGEIGREQMAVTPARVVHSAKSWLCHRSVNALDPCLPWSNEDVKEAERISPVDASALILAHIRYRWDQAFAQHNADHSLAKQEVTVTVPASFDESARKLTLEACSRAGYGDVRLLEEPQAAFYHWLEIQRVKDPFLNCLWQNSERSPLTVLVCDIGGGTTDFSLFRIEATDDPDVPCRIRRIKVSEHLLLGGDNIDLTLAYLAEAKLKQEGHELTIRQWNHLIAEARRIKERLLAPNDQSQEISPVEADEQTANPMVTFTVPGEGASLFATTTQTSIPQGTLMAAILEGFFPLCDKFPTLKEDDGSIREWGLPFTQETGMTRHLAAFLEGTPVDCVLFNGGTLTSAVLRDRITQLISNWQGRSVRVLNGEPDPQAVALGAAYFSSVAEDKKLRIGGGYPRSIYIQTAVDGQTGDGGDKALVCVLEKGHDDYQPIRLSNLRFGLVVGQPVRFQLWHANNRDQDKPGDMLKSSQGLHPLPPLHIALERDAGAKRQASKVIPVHIESRISELGNLELQCVSEDQTQHWKLEFRLHHGGDPALTEPREAGHTNEKEETSGDPAQATVDAQRFDTAVQLIDGLYGKGKPEKQIHPKALTKELEAIFQMPRRDWDTHLLRDLWPILRDGMTRKGRSIDHEATWFNLAGFCLRPGFGVELDDWRMEDLWRVHQLGMQHAKQDAVRIQWWIMWRRVAGGLDRAQQDALLSKLYPTLRKNPQALPTEALMLIAALEQGSVKQRQEICEATVQMLHRTQFRGSNHFPWSVTRLLGRAPLYGSPQQVLPATAVIAAFNLLKDLPRNSKINPPFNSIFFQAARIVQDRERDLPEADRLRIRDELKARGGSAEQLAPLEEYVPLSQAEQDSLFGDTLPIGLYLSKL